MDMTGHDIIVIGASAGGVEALSKLVMQFPDDLLATVFVVQHVSATARGRLAEILDRAGPLPATLAQDGATFQQAHIYVAPPDHHLLVKEGNLRVTRGLRENRVRPAIDPLFRSAALTYGARVVGVILSGLQDDGTAGLLAVKRCGGVTMVQDPTDALYPEMPRNALTHVEVDHCLPVSKMGAVLYRLTQETAATLSIPPDIVTEVEIVERTVDTVSREEELGTLVPLTCPDCGGPLWELHNDGLQRYRCRLGHALTATSLLGGQSEVIETALWTAVRTMEERAHMFTLLAHSRQEQGQEKLVERYVMQATELITHAKHIRQILLGNL
jgi:two-component system, chemotaxis family, protein-glutamate methylesterase/glutaminase